MCSISYSIASVIILRDGVDLVLSKFYPNFIDLVGFLKDNLCDYYLFVFYTLWVYDFTSFSF